ncbi:MAG: TetR/AcrR family transcriptional regulator [Stackebrandtia sp.]
MSELYTIGEPPPRERADAARNRARILSAAERLFARDGIAQVSLDAIAAEAGVGKGTVFRRFEHKAGLAAALLDDHERRLQTAILSGPPPLGPGAPARERLIAFVTGYLDFLEPNLDLVMLSQTSHQFARFRVGSYGFWRQHVSILLSQIDAGWDAEYLAHAVLAPLSAELVAELASAGMSFDRIGHGVVTLAEAIVTSAGPPATDSAPDSPAAG